MSTTVKEHSFAIRQSVEDRPLVSVIMIFRNEERFIEEAIESIFAQTYNHWELLLVDDGSNDASTQIACAVAFKNPHKVRYLEHAGHQNQGMSASRNLGIRKANGELIAFLDADDVWVAVKLEQQVAILNSHPQAAMVFGSTRYWYSWTGESRDKSRDFVPRLDVGADQIVEPPLIINSLLRNQIATATSALIRRVVAQEVGGYEESFRGLFEDQVFHSKICLSAPVYVSSHCWYNYRKHEQSCCAEAERRNGEQHSKRLGFLNWLEAYTRERGLGDGELFRLIKRERWKSRHPVLSRSADHLRYRSRTGKEGIKSFARRTLPRPLYSWIRNRRHSTETRIPIPIGSARLGDLRRLTPISRVFGFDRGTPVDRYYIEAFLERNARAIQGRVLEVGDDAYTRRFGGERVSNSDVLHVSEAHPRATIVADLASAAHIPADLFDCIILTQTLHLIYDLRAALSTLHRILKPGGVLLATMPGISQIDHYDWSNSWYWSFTALSATRLFAESFLDANLTVQTHGNVLAAVAFLHGLAVEEFKHDELDHHDPDYQLIVTVCAIKETRE